MARELVVPWSNANIISVLPNIVVSRLKKSFGRAASRVTPCLRHVVRASRRAIRGSLRSYLAAKRAFGALMSASVRVASRTKGALRLRAATIPLAAGASPPPL